MAGKTIALTLEGPANNDGHVELSVFAEKIKHFLDLLNANVKERSKESVFFHVVRLSHSSPTTIECEPATRDGDADTIAHEIGESLARVQEEKTQHLSHTVLSAMEQLVKFKDSKIVRAEVRIIGNDDEDKRIYKLDNSFKERLSQARCMEEKTFSTIDGRLEQINIHNNANTFRIYTALPMFPFINCVFPESLLERVQNSLGSFVSVSGTCVYRPDAPFPYRIKVQDMTVLPPTKDLPSLSDLYGIAPSTEGEKPSEQFVRELRDTWGKEV